MGVLDHRLPEAGQRPAAGSLPGGALLVLWDVYGWGTRRRVPAELIGDERRIGRWR